MPATAEPIAQEPVTNIGDVFAQALAQEQGKGEASPATPKPAPEKKAEAKQAVEPVREGKFKSTIDTLLETKPAEKAPDAEPDVLAGFEEKNPDWKRARETMGTQSAEIKRLKAEVVKVSTPDPKLAGELETLRKERADVQAELAKYRDAITALNVDYDPAIREKFVDGRQRLLDKAAARVKEYGGDPEAFNDALRLTGKRRTEALREALTEVDDIDKGRITSLLEKVNDLDEEHADLQKDPQQAWEKLTQQRTKEAQRQNEEAEQMRNVEFEKISKSVAGDFVLLRSHPDDEKWNSELKADLDKARSLFTPDAAYDDAVTYALKGVRADRAQALWLEEREARIKAEKQLSEYSKAEPGFRGTGKTETKSALDKTPGELYTETMAKLSAQTD